MTQKGVVLLFGTFNPFTNAHLQIGLVSRDYYPDYDVYYVPAKASFLTGYKGLDSESVLSEDNRISLIEGSIAKIPNFFVTDIEVKGLVNGKTMNTISYFKEALGYEDVVLCFGTDKVSELESWYRGEELVRDNKFLIITRDGNTLDSVMTEYTNKYRDNFKEITNSSYATVSGSLVRRAISEKNFEFIKDSVPEYVYNKLYNMLKKENNINV